MRELEITMCLCFFLYLAMIGVDETLYHSGMILLIIYISNFKS